jgi:hypothetical protein
VDLFPALVVARKGVLSLVRPVGLVFEPLPLAGVVDETLGGGEDGLEALPNRTSLPLPFKGRFSGEGRREDSSDRKAEPIGPGMRLPAAWGRFRREWVKYLGAMLAAYPCSKSDVDCFLAGIRCRLLLLGTWRIGAYSCSLSETTI